MWLFDFRLFGRLALFAARVHTSKQPSIKRPLFWSRFAIISFAQGAIFPKDEAFFQRFYLNKHPILMQFVWLGVASIAAVCIEIWGTLLHPINLSVVIELKSLNCNAKRFRCAILFLCIWPGIKSYSIRFYDPQEMIFKVISSIFIVPDFALLAARTSASAIFLQFYKKRYSGKKFSYGETPRVFRFLFPGSFWADDVLHENLEAYLYLLVLNRCIK